MEVLVSNSTFVYLSNTSQVLHVQQVDLTTANTPAPILYCLHMWSRNKINSVLATIYFISAPSVRTCRAEIK